MVSKIRPAFIVVVMVLFAIGLLQSAHAYNFQVSEFTVMKNGSPLFQDTFNDVNNPFPSGRSFGYNVVGTFGPETGNKLQINSTDAVPVVLPNGNVTLYQGATLLTSSESGSTLGLRTTSSFSVTGIFDLILPTIPLEGYGVRLTDSTSVTPNATTEDILWMRVIMYPAHSLMVQFARNDYVAHQTVVIGEALLETGHDQVGLRLTRGSTSSNAIEGSFYYIDGGTPGSLIPLANTTNIFHGEDFTRASFGAFTPVPLPGAIWLLAPGLAGLVAARRRLRK